MKWLAKLLPEMAPPAEEDEKLGYRKVIPYDVCLADGDIIDIGNVRVRRVGLNLRVMVKDLDTDDQPDTTDSNQRT